ncbi:MAG: S1 RNA-binding domain-containing protein [Candidatus Heimdallarchaeota archaeon]|nr:S1 RNA-binding domain-containing protein [Candidatus Heimdallarchaeota archaeon]
MVTFKQVPDVGEIVICKVVDINPNSVYVDFIEYNAKGMIHVSEMSNSWVRDIRKLVKPAQVVVCVVRNNQGHFINLSIKRVKTTQKRAKITEWKNEKKAENILKFISEDLGIELDDAYEKIGYPLIESAGNMYSVFLRAVREGKKVLEVFGFDKKTVDSIYSFVVKNIKLKIVIVKRKVRLYSFDSDGLLKIKQILDLKDADIKVKFISSSRFEISAEGLDPLVCEKTLDSVMVDIKKKISALKCNCVFEVVSSSK